MTDLEKLQIEARMRHMSTQLLYDIHESAKLNDKPKIKKSQTPEAILKREIKLQNRLLLEEKLKLRQENKRKFAELRKQASLNKKLKRVNKKLVSDFMEVMEGLFFIVPADRYIFKNETTPPVKIEVKEEPVSPKEKLDFNRMKKYIPTAVSYKREKYDEEPQVNYSPRPPAKYSNRKAIDDYEL